ncbi:hypothetical protein CERSUDRAFT_118038 [Gelatoporia subvermispora B]|uniref:Uncharacterized protein n=1 Tax=Ceriporiopsis subvermispora (strain B) TaxID=914234 RepID=M2Q9B9_CERS8|nr:hypothetical protein CERSUDRAFT_118038 [Gelatoporia subvermispora B]
MARQPGTAAADVRVSTSSSSWIRSFHVKEDAPAGGENDKCRDSNGIRHAHVHNRACACSDAV